MSELLYDKYLFKVDDEDDMVFLASLRENGGDMAYELELVGRREKRSALLEKFQFIRNVKRKEQLAKEALKKQAEEEAVNKAEEEALNKAKEEAVKKAAKEHAMSPVASSPPMNTNELEQTLGSDFI